MRPKKGLQAHFSLHIFDSTHFWALPICWQKYTLKFGITCNSQIPNMTSATLTNVMHIILHGMIYIQYVHDDSQYLALS